MPVSGLSWPTGVPCWSPSPRARLMGRPQLIALPMLNARCAACRRFGELVRLTQALAYLQANRAKPVTHFSDPNASATNCLG